MSRFRNSLNQVSVAAPCESDWDQMIGDERVRFCGQCSLNVYDLSNMARADAESLIARTEGRLCVRFYRRRDGSIITKDCPEGLRAIRRRVSYFAKAIGSMVLGLFAGLGVHESFSSIASFRAGRTMGVMALRVDPSAADPPNVNQPVRPPVMGKMMWHPTRRRSSREERNTGPGRDNR